MSQSSRTLGQGVTEGGDRWTRGIQGSRGEARENEREITA
jgi:hypothetical protein